MTSNKYYYIKYEIYFYKKWLNVGIFIWHVTYFLSFIKFKIYTLFFDDYDIHNIS